METLPRGSARGTHSATRCATTRTSTRPRRELRWQTLSTPTEAADRGQVHSDEYLCTLRTT